MTEKSMDPIEAVMGPTEAAIFRECEKLKQMPSADFVLRKIRLAKGHCTAADDAILDLLGYLVLSWIAERDKEKV